MTPDTTAYMSAGLAVIFSGIALYAFSLWFRKRKLK